MKPTIALDSKDVRLIIAKFLNIPIENVIPQRYGYAVEAISEEAIEEKLDGGNG